ncbi:GIY-YIG nuclease family protein [Carboxylicivirga sp. M1479]|uniref:GIY-YIG nuclease family protein n=1 Tax=Carboxylicivirga sp. M1479 TaxID=2594476 RepID=UPI0011786266|nr:GIY-YIG nuclease family protein [Carboxylicivirga sp. M1479]TRX65766.1 GIY-YIG nuclease family protein [Carboxylicivirga sp. M1479]
MCFFYILHSPSKDKYYIGATCDTLESRLSKHNMKHIGYTGQASDWEVAHFEIYKTKKEAFDREKQVKKWKSKQRTIKLINGD